MKLRRPRALWRLGPSLVYGGYTIFSGTTT